jgi:ABC-type uncharacterized transport system permease subunit
LLGATVDEEKQIQQFIYVVILFYYFQRELIDYAIRTIKPALDALPKDCKVGIHICRGNGTIKWTVYFFFLYILGYFYKFFIFQRFRLDTQKH